MNGEFRFYDANIDIRDNNRDNKSSVDLEQLHSSIRKSWRYEDRKTISHIGVSDFSKHIAEVKMNDNISPPKIGGYPHRMLKFGWGYYHYDANKLYLARIKYNHEDGFYVKGYSNDEINNGIGIISGVDIDHRTISDEQYVKENINEIHRIISNSWSKEDLTDIKSIEQGEDKRVYLIKTESSVNSVSDLEGREVGDLEVDSPTVPTKDNIRCLIQNGWGVISIKRNEIYLSKIQKYISSEKSYDFRTKKDKINTYKPKPCEECGEREYVGEFIAGYKKHKDRDQEVPDFKLLCKECS